jgi:hypothetical protein
MAEAGIRGVPQGAETVQRTSPNDAIDKMLEEDRRMSARIKLTWSSNKPPGVPNDRMVGEVNLYLPYLNFRKKYIVQNAKIYLSNGEPTNLEYIRLATSDACQFCVADGDSWRRRVAGDTCCLYAEVANGYDVYMRDAIKRDPLLCKRPGCGNVAVNVDDYSDHREICGRVIQEPATVSVGVKPTDDGPISCDLCGRVTKSMFGMKLHKTRMHD